MRKKIIFILFSLLTLLFPSLTFAATFSLMPRQGTLSPQVTTSVDIKLSSPDSLNVVSVVINYPIDLLDITWIKTDTSAFSVGVEQSINNGQIRISRGTLNPVSGSDIQVAALGVTPKAAGSATLELTDSSAALSSLGGDNLLNLALSTGANFSIVSPAPTPQASTNTSVNSSLTTPTPAPSPANTNPTCPPIPDTLKSKLMNKYKSVSKTFVRLDTISTLTNNYYQTKMVPQENVFPEFSEYNNQVDTARQAALTTLSSLQSITNNLNCTNVKEQIKNFKSEIVKLKKNLIDYQHANINLLVQLKGI